MNARIVETTEGRVLITELKVPIGQKTHCIEFHHQKEHGYRVTFMLFTRDELAELCISLEF